MRAERIAESGDAPSPDVIGSTCVGLWELLLSPAADTDASQIRAPCVSKDIQQSDRALRRYVRPVEIRITEPQR